MAEIIVKFLLLALVAMPFAALLSDMAGKTHGLMSRVVVGVTIIFTIAAVLLGPFQTRPNVANVVCVAFFTWPVLLLIAKMVNPSISWYSIWTTVPIMSWYLVNLIVMLTHSGPFGGAITLILGWSYMIIPFAILCAVFVGVQTLVRKIKAGK